jgi:hypothetical protein
MPCAEQEVRAIRAFLDRKDGIAERYPVVIRFVGRAHEIGAAIIDQPAEMIGGIFQPACIGRVFIDLIEAGLDREPFALTQQGADGVAQRFARLHLERIHQVCRRSHPRAKTTA